MKIPHCDSKWLNVREPSAWVPEWVYAFWKCKPVNGYLSEIVGDNAWYLMTYHDKYRRFITKDHEISSSVTQYHQMSPCFKKHGDIRWYLVTICDKWWYFMTFYDHQKRFKKHGDIWWHVMKVHDIPKPFQRGTLLLKKKKSQYFSLYPGHIY